MIDLRLQGPLSVTLGPFWSIINLPKKERLKAIDRDSPGAPRVTPCWSRLTLGRHGPYV